MFDSFVRYYDLDYGEFDDDLLFYREWARMQGSRVLDAMCGTGRVALPLAQAGLQVWGVDIAPAMIKLATARAHQAAFAEQVHFQVADVRTLDLQQRFDMALVAVNSFMHLETVADQLAALERIYAHLAPQGILVLDLFNPDPVYLSQVDGSYVFDKTFVVPETGHTVQKFVSRSIDISAQHMQVTFCYDEINATGQVQRLVLPFGMRWLYRYELEHILVRSGFVLEHVYGSYDLDAYDSAAERLLVVARRIDS